MDPANYEEQLLIEMMMESLNANYPGLRGGDRLDIALNMFTVVKWWALLNDDVKQEWPYPAKVKN